MSGSAGANRAECADHHRSGAMASSRARQDLALGTVAQPIDYMLKRWHAFARFLDDGRICLTNNAAERALRGFALGRKSWLFAGSERGADRAAAITTLISTAKLNDVDPFAWLADVLARIADTPQSRLPDLLPWNWSRLNCKPPPDESAQAIRTPAVFAGGYCRNRQALGSDQWLCRPAKAMGRGTNIRMARRRCRRLAKDWENLNRKALAFLRLASIRLMLRKLCNPADLSRLKQRTQRLPPYRLE